MKAEIPVNFMPLTNQNSDQMGMRRECSFYFHIPICSKKCLFCSIKTTQYDDVDRNAYAEALIKEFNKYRYYHLNYKINCVYFGGGTPTLLSLAQIDKILTCLKNAIPDIQDVEIVFEAHPESLTQEIINYLSQHPKLTLNIGVQTFQENQLVLVNRTMQVRNLIGKLECAAKSSLHSLGIDLIIGLPNSSIGSVLDDVKTAVNLGIDNISLYTLRIEKGSQLYESSYKNCCKIPTVCERIKMLDLARAYLTQCGYFFESIFRCTDKKSDAFQYLKGQINGGEWIGIGAGAYSYLNQKVYLNDNCINNYIESTMKDDNINHVTAEKQNRITKLIWDLSFKLRDGYFDLSEFCATNGFFLESCLKQLMKQLCDLGYAIYKYDNVIIITSKGIVHFDEIEPIIEKVVLEKHDRN